jgi:hypothetical protein
MGIFSSIKTGGTLAFYLPSIIIILCLYICWLGAYEYNDEGLLGALLIILGLLYVCVVYLALTGHPMFGSSMIFATVIIIISIAAVSGFKQKDGSSDFNFVCLGLSPMISGICFASCVIFAMYGLAQTSMVTGGIM